jgi:hypothetical protein
MPCHGDPGWLPPLRASDCAAIVRLAAAADVHHVVGADELDADRTRDPWHAFADLMDEVSRGAAGLDDAGQAALAARLDMAIAALEASGARVIAGAAGGILYVAVLGQGRKRDPRFLFAAAG